VTLFWIQIQSYDGKNKLSGFLEGTASLASFKNVTSLGITRDADEQGIESSEQAIHGALNRAGLTENPNDITPKNPRLQIKTHIVCDSSGMGKLESMILETVADDWRTACIENFFTCLEEQAPENNSLPKDHEKARLGIYLASLRRSAIRPEFGEQSDKSCCWTERERI